MYQSDVIVSWIAELLQITVACRALRLTRLFGTKRAGWSLFAAFLLLAITHKVQSASLFTTDDQFVVEFQTVYALISLLLIVGMAHNRANGSYPSDGARLESGRAAATPLRKTSFFRLMPMIN